MSTAIPKLDVVSGKWNASEKFFLNNQEGSTLELFEPRTVTGAATPTLLRSLSFGLLNRLSSTSDSTDKTEQPSDCYTHSARPVKRYFVIAEPIGKGGEATVHKAYPIQNDDTLDTKHPVTLKFYQHGDGATEAGINAILGETVERIYLIDHKQHVTVLPYHEGKPLNEYFAEHPTNISTLSLKNFLQQLRINLYAACLLADNLCYLHRTTLDRDIVIAHTDIKHQNVLIDVKAGTDAAATNQQAESKEKIALHIIDYGLATVLNGRRDRRTGLSKGTLFYMANEAVCGKGIGVKTDVFSSTPLLLNFLGADKPLANKRKARYSHSDQPKNPLFCREIDRFTQLAIVAEPFRQQGALSWDPLSVGIQVSHFVTRMEEEDYQQRANSHEVFIFMNTLRLLIDTWHDAVIKIKGDLVAIASEDLQPSTVDDIQILKARLTLLSLNLYDAPIDISGFLPSPKGLIAPVIASWTTTTGESITPFQLNTYAASSDLANFARAVNRLYNDNQTASQRKTLCVLMKKLLVAGLTLQNLTRAIELLPWVTAYVDHYTLTADQLFCCLINPSNVERLQKNVRGLTFESGAGVLLLNYLSELDLRGQETFLQQLPDHDLANLLGALNQNCHLPETCRKRIYQQCSDQQKLSRFKRSYLAQYQSEWFCSIFGSKMLRLIQTTRLTSLRQVDEYIRLKPHSRSAKVYARLSLAPARAHSA